MDSFEYKNDHCDLRKYIIMNFSIISSWKFWLLHIHVYIAFFYRNETIIPGLMSPTSLEMEKLPTHNELEQANVRKIHSNWSDATNPILSHFAPSGEK